MKKPYLLLACLTLLLFILPFGSAQTQCWTYDGNQSACQNQTNCNWDSQPFGPGPDLGFCQELGCWSFQNNASCSNYTATLGCTWQSDQWGSWCQGIDCFGADNTNQTHCEVTLNATHGIECQYTNSTGWCDPLGGFGFATCAAYDGDQFGCQDTGFCEWNSTDSTCGEPDFADFGFDNPSCGVFSTENDCTNVVGCSWNSTLTQCDGLPSVSCSDINDSNMCNTIPMLNTCCAWSGGSCNQTLAGDCWNNMQPPPTGANFCEDYNSFKNQTLCNQIATSPWFMPCQWNNVSSECSFNGASFFGGEGGGFDEIGSQSTCEAAGGTWNSEVYSTPDGNQKTDEWCEFAIGSKGNCDSSCWSCENKPNGDAWENTSVAQTACEQSLVGFCQFTADTGAFNGYGWCDPNPQVFAGGGDCDTNCWDCDFMNSPASACNASIAGCKWVTDVSNSAVGWCENKNAKTCDNDCFKCYDQTDCTTYGKGGNNACTWDPTNYLCKPAGFDGEICFDGTDNDNDNKIDCADPDCGFDAFCGGEVLDTLNCGFEATNASCTTAGCVWIRDDFDIQNNFSGHCGFPGEQCWIHDDSNASCSGESGCKWIVPQGADVFCDVNKSLASSCFNQMNTTLCNADGNCTWVNDTFGGFGWCEFKQFNVCHQDAVRQLNESNCISDGLCGWENMTFAPNGGWCGPKCFNLNNSQCSADASCELAAGFCEPENFGGDCWALDGNQTACTNKTQCHWDADPYGPAPDNGWCNDAFMAQMFTGMSGGEPIILGEDACGSEGLQPYNDICGFGLKDNPNSYGLGTRVFNIEGAALCNGKPVNFGGSTGGGTNTTKFYWYLDTDGVDTNNCNSDDAAQAGFEFRMKYEASWSSGALSETRVSYQCFNGSWSPVAIPLSSIQNVMCNEIGGAMVSIDKKTIQSFKTLFNKSANMRIYATLANQSGDQDTVSDAVGPAYYTPGTIDFAFEDCSAKGEDLDGDGFNAENDPDCIDFFKFGYIPSEGGPQCSDSIDNDDDGQIDCNDLGCKYDQYFCNGTFAPDSNDKTSPKIVWLDKDIFPDAAFLMYDTDEPSNGTLLFYGNQSTCININKTIRDVGLVESFVPEFKQWHDAPIDNFAGNSEALGWNLLNATSYFYKTKNCDPSGNCAVSKCLNFTTKGSFNKCTDCQATFKFVYSPPPGTNTTDPTGNLDIKVKWADGTEETQGSTSVNANYTKAKNATIVFSNQNSTEYWEVAFKGVNLKKLTSTSKNITSGDIAYNESGTDNFVGLDDDKCNQLIQELRPEKLEIGIPGNVSDFWHCPDNLVGCINKSLNATNLGYNTTLNFTSWEIPATWGC